MQESLVQSPTVKHWNLKLRNHIADNRTPKRYSRVRKDSQLRNIRMHRIRKGHSLKANEWLTTGNKYHRNARVRNKDSKTVNPALDIVYSEMLQAWKNAIKNCPTYI